MILPLIFISLCLLVQKGVHFSKLIKISDVAFPWRISFLLFEWWSQYVIALFLVWQICETYPRDLYVPVTASKPIIVGSSKFRSKGRFPVLTYFYQEKKVHRRPPPCTVLVHSSTSTKTRIKWLFGQSICHDVIQQMLISSCSSPMCPPAFNIAVKLTRSVLSCNRQQCADAASRSLGSVRDA